ncbi:hypothetical protein [Streptomyces cadmiisoli]|uniref:Lipoprotein n=1 Tax=Streptomyces cadmiisoli TaxID=2184053 RepID=A0A2Z4JEM1_9ACTN|nr:hypothetical protein [Streptomyces cadmiisoli]AWW43441.1 hypothetical protein DN051_43595 [Streptomyces cadmiisoli]
MHPVRATLALIFTASVLAGCTEASGDNAAPKPSTAPARSTAPPPREIPFDLYTHCGIEEARIGSTYYEADPPLSDGADNPPAGWENPTQQGTMTLVSQTEAVFRDDRGHEVVFRARPGATGFKQICQ